MPSFTLAIERDGRLLYAKGYGSRNIAPQVRADAETIYEIGSLTKQFTATAVMMLVQGGKVHLDAPIATYLSGIPFGKQITVRELLTHTSGLPNYTDQPGFLHHVYSQTTPRAIVATVASKPLDFTPGTKWSYSNTNYAVLGLLIAKESGVSYPQFLRTNIFRPLRLQRTFYSDTFPPATDVARPYDVDGSATKPVHLWNLSWAYAAGGLWSDAEDLVRWENALFSDRIVDASSLGQMTTPAKLADGSSPDYGFGFLISTLYGHREIWHNGGLPGYSTRDAYFPHEHLEIAVLGDTVDFKPGPVLKGVFMTMYPPTAAEIAAAVPTPAPGEDAAITARAHKLLDQAQKGKFNRSQFTAEVNTALTASVVASVAQQLGPLGSPQHFIYIGKHERDALTVYTYRLIWPSVALNEIIALDKSGTVGGIFFANADESPPASASPSPAASSSPTSGAAAEAPADTNAARAREWLTRSQKGDIDRSQLAPALNTAMTPDAVKSIAQQLGPLGAPESFTFLRTDRADGIPVSVYHVVWKSTSLNEGFGVAPDGKIAIFYFRDAE